MLFRKIGGAFIQFLSKISVRMLIFNILLLFLPMGGMLWLNTYEKQLLRAQENTMVQQGRLLSAALSGEPNREKAEEILFSLRGRSESRLRVLDRGGNILADSSRIFSTIEKKEEPKADDPDWESVSREPSWFYDLVTLPVRIYRRMFYPPDPDPGAEKVYSSDKPLLGPEVQAALEGRYGAVTRLTTGGEKSITLYSAIPIRDKEEITGVILVSQSTYRILIDLYEIRLRIFQIFLASVIVASVISLLFSRTIISPLLRLRNEAEALLDRRGRLTKPFMQMNRKDEIGDLAHALAELTGRLEKHIRFIEAFARDLSHEFKNPLAAIRSAAEVALEAESREDQARFLKMIRRDVDRMERLLSGAREISRIDTEAVDTPPGKVNLSELIRHLVAGFGLRKNSPPINLIIPEEPVFIRGCIERLAQVFENILDNGVSFSPPGEALEVEIHKQEEYADVTVRDYGPGINPANLDRIFNRFFTFREGTGKKEHTGLGLAIVKAVVENYGGQVFASPPEGPGALFRVRFPLVRE